MLPVPKQRGRPGRNPGPIHASPRRRWLLVLGVILALTALVYVPSLRNGFVNWDDDKFVTKNPLVPHPSFWTVLTTPLGGNYHPLTVWSLALNYRISGFNPASYHGLDLLLHLLNTALVFLFVRTLSRDRFWTTAITALFFGIHPMHVESVAWIAERKDVLYAFFYLIALISYLSYLDRKQPVWIAGTFVAFVLSAGSKPAAVVLPLTLLAIDFYRRRPWGSRVLLEKVPFFAVSIAVGLWTLEAQHGVGAIGDPKLWSPFQRVLFASYGVVMYVVKMFVPVRLSAIYPYPSAGTKNLGPEFYAAGVALAILLAAILYLCRKDRPTLFGIAFFFINIILVLQLMTFGTAVLAERYTYLPYVGLFFALAWQLDKRQSSNPLVRPVLAGVFLALLPVCLVQTWKRCEVWHDPLTLWNDTIRKHPDQSVDAHYNRGVYYASVGRLAEAMEDYDRALAVNPGAIQVWYNKGTLLAQQDSIDSAFVCFERVLRLDPNHVDALNNRGAMKFRRGDVAGAAEDFSRMITLNPKSPLAYANRALAYSAMGEYEKSIADHRRAVEAAPNNPANYQEAAAIADDLQRLNRNREAISEYDKAIAGAPRGEKQLGAYYLARSRAWLGLNDRARALADARDAARLGAAVDPAYLRRLGG